MNTENTFLNILKEGKGDLESIKNIIIKNKNIINTEFELNNNSEKLIYSPLTYCIEKKLSELSIFLIEQGANINYKTFPNEDYPLLIACRHGLEDIVKKLLLYDNIDINCLNKNNETCYTILLNNLNGTIYNLIVEYVQKKSNKTSNNKKKDNKFYGKKPKKIENKKKEMNDIKDSNNKEKHVKTKKKIMIRRFSFDFPMEYTYNYINAKIGKFISFFKILY